MKEKCTLNGKSTEENRGATLVWKGAVTARSQHGPWGHTATQRIGFIKMKKKIMLQTGGSWKCHSPWGSRFWQNSFYRFKNRLWIQNEVNSLPCWTERYWWSWRKVSQAVVDLVHCLDNNSVRTHVMLCMT